MTTNHEIIYTNQAPEPIGPYSQAIRWGQLLYLSGQVAINPVTGQMMDGDITVQTRQVMANIRAVLEQSGSSMAQVLKTTVFLRNFDDFPRFNSVYQELFTGHKPARSTVEVSRLPKEALVEIELVAYC